MSTYRENNRIELDICDECVCHEDTLAYVKENMPDEDDMYELAELFKVFGDSTRIRILSVLLMTEMCVCDLAESLNMTASAISHQLRILKQNKLVKNRRDGKTVYYSLDDEHVRDIIAEGMEHVKE